MKKRYPLIFIVEDNVAYSKIVDHHLKSNNFEYTMTFTSGEECLKHLFHKPDIIIQDYKLQGISGLNVLQRAKILKPYIEFLFLSSQESIEIAVNTVKYGAFDYIVKNDVALQRLIQKIDHIIKLQKLRKRHKLQMKLMVILTVIALLLFLGTLMMGKHYR
jgi:DNA-binding NtrC family response regulator